MTTPGRWLLPLLFLCLVPPSVRGAVDFSPSAIAANPDGSRVFVAGATGGEVVELDAAEAIVHRWKVPGLPSGLTLTRDGKKLYVTCSAPDSIICEIDIARDQIARRFPAGHSTMAPVLSPDESVLYVCNRFNNETAVYRLGDPNPAPTKIPVGREPVAAASTPDGATLFVASHLPSVPANAPRVAAVVSVIDTASSRVEREISLPNGSSIVTGVAVSPDGRYAAVVHNVARFSLPTTQLDRGWMNTAALTLIDVPKKQILNTVLLDSPDLGAANPAGVAWSPDGQKVVVTHAGTHEVSVIRFPALLAKLAAVHEKKPGTGKDFGAASDAEVPNDLAFLVGLRDRVKLAGNGPRAIAISGSTAFVADYFSDTIEKVDLGHAGASVLATLSDPLAERSQARMGERWFHDARLSFQGWQSCATCHSFDARVDGLNWDLLNDGIGNPKNTKSLLLAHSTPPSMSLGVRESPEAAVRAGIRHILFTEQPESVAQALDAYLKALRPLPSPHLENGTLSAAARRGKKLFESADTACSSCHPPGLFTDLKTYDVGTGTATDAGATAFDTPTLVEIWRTAPYLHDGSAATLRDVLKTRNPNDRHGMTSQLTPAQLDDLMAYLLSL